LHRRDFYRIEEYITEKTAISKLRDISFFSEMADHDLTQIAEITVERNYKKGAVIIEEMTEAERFFIIHKGKIEITKRYEGYEDFVLSVQSDGDFFGEMALLDEGRRSATVRAIESTTVLEISRNDFETLLYKAPALAYKIMKELSARLRETGALLISHLKQQNRQLLKAYVETMRIVLSSISDSEAHPPVVELTLAIGRELAIDDEGLLLIEFSSLLHDLGALATSGQPALEQIVPKMLKAQGGFGPSYSPEAGSKAPRDIDKLIALADAYSRMAARGAATPRAAVLELRKGVPELYEAESIDALARLVKKDAKGGGL
jgi:CRP-like cAMP-binding protein